MTPQLPICQHILLINHSINILSMCNRIALKINNIQIDQLLIKSLSLSRRSENFKLKINERKYSLIERVASENS